MTEAKKAGRPPKEKVSEEKDLKKAAKELKEAQDLVATMAEEIRALKNVTPKKVKCISLAHHPVNVFTQPNLTGKQFRFIKYGQVMQIKYDDLLDILACYPKTMESGLIFICNREVVEDNGLGEAYERIYDKATMDEIVYMRKPSDADLVLGMSEDLRESAVIKIAQLYKSGEKMDANALLLLKEKGIDIAEYAKEGVFE